MGAPEWQYKPYPPASLEADPNKPARIVQDDKGRLWLEYYDKQGQIRRVPIVLSIFPQELADLAGQIPLKDFIQLLRIKIAESDIMVPIDIQGQCVYIKGLIAPLKDAIAKYSGSISRTFDDVGGTQSVISVPTGYYAIVWYAEIVTDANTDYARLVVDGYVVSKTVGASTTSNVVNSSMWPFGIPAKTDISLEAKAVATTTTTVTARIWYWLVPTSP